MSLKSGFKQKRKEGEIKQENLNEVLSETVNGKVGFWKQIVKINKFKTIPAFVQFLIIWIFTKKWKKQ